MAKNIYRGVIPFFFAFVLVSTLAQAAPGGKEKVIAATVESTSAAHVIYYHPFDQTLETTTYPEIRRISITIFVQFGDSLADERVEVLAQLPDGGYFPVRRYVRSEHCCQIIETFEFNADRWQLRAFQNDSSAILSPVVEYTATTIY